MFHLNEAVVPDGEEDQQFSIVELVVVACVSTSSNHGAIVGAHKVVNV